MTSTLPSFHRDGTSPSGDWIFVFGSNLAGRHGAGAAKAARLHFGAVYGVGMGPTGRAYALPTKDLKIRTLPLPAVARHVADFLSYAHSHPELKLFVTRVGCGLAGYSDDEIGPMFAGAPGNCSLPEEWERFVTAARAAAAIE